MRARFFILLVAGLGISGHTFSQNLPVDTLEINEVSTGIYSGGDLFYGPDGNASFEVPQGQNTHSLYRGNLWIGGLDDSGQLRVAGQTYRQSGTDYWPGPVAANYDSAYDDHYERLWKVSKSEIDDHILNWNNAGYIVPEVIANWPAHGDTANGEAQFLAPFVDVNNDQQYDPAQGDYPAIRGDQAILFIINDLRDLHTETGGEPVGAEIQGMVYAYNDPGETAVNQTVFVHYTITNRGGNLNQAYLSMWTDIDLGFGFDDFIGTDTALNAVYGFNGDSIDGTATYGYMDAPPAVGIVFLNRSLDGNMFYFNDFTPTGNPEVAQHFYGYQTSYWKDGSPLTIGGAGYDTSAAAAATPFAFAGDPVTNTGWHMGTVSNINPSDWRVLPSHRAETLLSGESVCFDVAFTWARDTSGTNLSNLDLLRDRIQDIHSFYQSESNNCPSPLASVEPGIHLPEVRLFPNPADEKIHILIDEIAGRNVQITLRDLQGRMILTHTIRENNPLTAELDIASLSQGIYLAEVQIGDSRVIKKFMKQ